MPLIFILSGVNIFLILFDFVKFKNKNSRLMILFLSCVLCFSYFIDFVSIDDIEFNFIQCILIVSILVLAFAFSKNKLFNFLFFIINLIIFFVISQIDFNEDNLYLSIEYVSIFAILFALIFYNYFDGLYFIIFFSLQISFIYLMFEYKAITFAFFNSEFVFINILIYSIFFHIFHSTNFKSIYLKGRNYEKNCF